MDYTKTRNYSYELPKNLIAQTPIEPRDSSKLFVYNKKTEETSHKVFRDITDYLKEGDVLVINNTKVLPVKLIGIKDKTNAKIEILLVKKLSLTNYLVLAKPGKRLKNNTILIFSEKLQCKFVKDADDGLKEVEFIYNGVFEDILHEIGYVPLPHYINKEDYKDIARYNTVYSKITGSSAAPTAGLHFTKELLEKIKQKGVIITEVLLNVGLGTFRPVKVENILEHKMHSEYVEVSAGTAEVINKAKAEGRRIIAVGTTSVRVLESCIGEDGRLISQKKETNIFIYPGYKFKTTDALITNFHLPESTLLMLISAFIGTEKTIELYNLAVKLNYRFFSFGDAMFIF